jgi:hyperosmotically inducible protein
MNSSLCKALGAAALALALAAGTAHAAATDAWITTKAKLALLTDDGVSASAINVDTVEGQVTMHGKVHTAAEKDKAQAVVSKIDGVKVVRNLLQVVPAPREEAVQATDDQIQKSIETNIGADKSLADSDVDVKSVNKGVVLLGGSAKSLTDHLRAVEIAAGVPGVKRVVSEIQGPDNLAVGEIWIEPDKNDDQVTYGATARDAYITSATKLRLLADGDTPALDINVDTRNGEVTLFGVVPTQEAKQAAEADARKVSGVKSVRNEIEVVAEKKAEIVEVNDDRLQEQVQTSLDKRNEFDDVDVEVKNGVARLTGSVPSQADRLQAAMVARATSGVRSVRDDLTIAD